MREVEVRTCQLGRKVVGQRTKGEQLMGWRYFTVPVADRQGGGCLAGGYIVVCAGMFVMSVVIMPPPVIVITMFQIQCQIVSVFHQRGMAGYLSVGGRVEFVLLDVQEAGHGKYIYMGGAPTPASSAPSLSC